MKEVQQIIKIHFEWEGQSMRSVWAEHGGLNTKHGTVEWRENTFHGRKNGHANRCENRLHEVILSSGTFQKALSTPLSLFPSFPVSLTFSVCGVYLFYEGWGVLRIKLRVSQVPGMPPPTTELHLCPLFYLFHSEIGPKLARLSSVLQLSCVFLLRSLEQSQACMGHHICPRDSLNK